MLRFYLTALSSPIFVLNMKQRTKKLLKNWEELKAYRYAQKIMNHMKRRSRTHTDVFGYENLPKEGGYILYSNHQGKYDALGILISHDEPCRVLMEMNQSKKIVARQVVDLLKGKRLDFSDPRQQLRVLAELAQEVKEGKRYLIFPEGGWKDNKNELQQFHSGCFRCAIDAKCPVIPVTLVDSYKGLNTNSLRKVTTQVHYLKPIMYEEYKDMKKNELCELVKTRIEEKLTEVLSARDAKNEK